MHAICKQDTREAFCFECGEHGKKAALMMVSFSFSFSFFDASIVILEKQNACAQFWPTLRVVLKAALLSTQETRTICPKIAESLSAVHFAGVRVLSRCSTQECRLGNEACWLMELRDPSGRESLMMTNGRMKFLVRVKSAGAVAGIRDRI